MASPARPPASEPFLLERAAAGDQRAREQIVERYLPLAQRLAGKYRGTPESIEDLEQVAALALIKAVDRYRPDRGSFKAFAVPTILGELKRHFRDRAWVIHVPRSIQEDRLRLRSAIEDLSADHGRTPTLKEVAARAGVDLEAAAEALQAGNALAPDALDAPAAGDEEGRALGETLGSAETGYETVELGASIAPAFAELPERERQILRLRFVDDLTQAEIAERIGLSQMHVSRLIRGSLELLREAVENEPAIPDK